MVFFIKSVYKHYNSVVNVDVHQHVWTEPFVEALERRARLPFVRRDGGACVVHVAGEISSIVDLEAEAPARRRSLLADDGLDYAVVALSSPLGIEALPRAEALELIEAHLQGVAALGEGFGAWGPLALQGARADDVDELLDRGCVGISLPAGAVSPPDSLRVLLPVLARAEERRAPLFIHPGPGLGQRAPEVSLSDPIWWPALTRYVAEMQAAWLSFTAIGRRSHPRLRVIFAMLAGGAPLLSERLVARGGPSVDLKSPLTFYDTSSYGPAAIDAMARRVTHEQLLYGSDRPVVEPATDSRSARLARNATWLASGATVAA
jgi:predicted TIM-barrel fold metal-dependent hydrolase